MNDGDFDAPTDNVSALERYMRSIRQESLTVCINQAQCKLLSQRLQVVYRTLSRLSSPQPTPQIMTVFKAADMLVQSMRHGAWLLLLERQLTCRMLFAALFERIPMVWQLQSTNRWVDENAEAVHVDEVADARVYLEQIHGIGMAEQGGLPRPSPSPHEGCAVSTERGCSADLYEASEEQVIDMFRRKTLSRWRLSFEDLTPPEEEYTTSAGQPGYKLFQMRYGYSYGVTPVLLEELQEFEDSPITPATVTGFVQDMVTRSRWFHPNIVPFVGAFTERMLPSESVPRVTRSDISDIEYSVSSEASPFGACNDDFAQTTVMQDLGTPVLSLGYIVEDVMCSVAQSLREKGGGLYTSYRIRPIKEGEEVEAFRPLHDLLFVEGRKFTIEDAMSITLQVADALQYVLMDDNNVPSEVSTEWTVVTPSHVYVCQINTVSETVDVLREGSMDAHAWPSSACSDAGSGDYDHDRAAPPFCGDAIQKRQCIELFALGNYAVMYSPPIYVEQGPYNRWKPHPQACCPASYAVVQLFLALLTNLPPYRSFTRQEELATRVFANPNVLYDDDPTLKIRVTVPIGMEIPHGLPPKLQKLCCNALALQSPRQGTQARYGISLEELRGGLWEVYASGINLTQVLSVDQEHGCRDAIRSVNQHTEPHADESGVAIEMEGAPWPLDDYGELPTNPF
ncbi:hypothetical protein TRVL_04565 [Trypanosoma vivax]|nr:hypothetical protein TRVL_04565 [Trypanosoma vivax]